jgi:hypothetical protein
MELSELLTKLLNRLYTQQEFKMIPRTSNYPSTALSSVVSSAVSPATAPTGQDFGLSMELVKPSVLG